MISRPGAFQSIMVPLDGSPLAEQAIPYAQAIAERGRCKLKLVLIHEPLMLVESGPDYAKVELARLKADRKYLKAVTTRLRERLGRSVSSAVLRGIPVAETLATYIREFGADLVVMTTHGRGGIRRAWLGSITDQLIRMSEVPILVVRPGEAKPTDSSVRLTEILVPLDGSPLAEAALPPAAALARLWDAEMSLVQVVHLVVLTSDTPLPFPTSYSDQMTRIQRESAQDSIHDVAERLRESGVKASGVAVIGGGVAETLLDLARPERTGLVAVATHGRGGLRRLVVGSVADKLVRAAEVPVLVVRPSGARKSGASRPVRRSQAAVVAYCRAGVRHAQRSGGGSARAVIVADEVCEKGDRLAVTCVRRDGVPLARRLVKTVARAIDDLPVSPGLEPERSRGYVADHRAAVPVRRREAIRRVCHLDQRYP